MTAHEVRKRPRTAAESVAYASGYADALRDVARMCGGEDLTAKMVRAYAEGYLGSAVARATEA